MTRPSARERLLAAADELFYTEGVQTVGIDRVIEHAGVAKASLYNTFGSKEALVRAYLDGRHNGTVSRLTRVLERHEDPRARLLAVFEAQGELFAEPGFRGCAFMNAAAEAQPGSAEALATKDFRTWLHELFTLLVAAAGYQNVPTLSLQLVLLYDGSNIAAQMDANPQAAQAARTAAETLLSTAPRA
jgi:AcrR family transcriptional regulator